MGNVTIPDWLRPVLARVVASGVAALVAYGARKGLDLGLSASEQQQLAEGVSAVVIGLAFSAYSLAHRAISARTNPTDAAAPVIAKAATGPMGAGERTALGGALDAAAKRGDV